MSRSNRLSLAALALLPLAALPALAQQAPAAGAARPAAAAAPSPATTTPAIAEVVAAGTAIEVLKDGLEAVEGPTPMADGGVLFTNNSTKQILRVAPDGTISMWMDNTGGANALTRLANGDYVATQNVDNAIAVVKPGAPHKVLASEFEGKRLQRPNDIVANKAGDIYFTDSAPQGVADPPLPSAVYRIAAKGGALTRVSKDITRPNGLALSPDEKTLYVANTQGESVIAFDVDASGEPKNMRDFAKLQLPPAQGGRPATSGADGIAVDEKGRLYVATTVGVQVVSAKGELLGVIPMPKQAQNLAFGGGPKRNVLYVVGRGSVYRINTLTKGPDRDRK
jgi:gluconolactonase